MNCYISTAGWIATSTFKYLQKRGLRNNLLLVMPRKFPIKKRSGSHDKQVLQGILTTGICTTLAKDSLVPIDHANHHGLYIMNGDFDISDAIPDYPDNQGIIIPYTLMQIKGKWRFIDYLKRLIG